MEDPRERGRLVLVGASMKGNEKMSARNMISYYEITAQREGIKGDSKLLSFEDRKTNISSSQWT